MFTVWYCYFCWSKNIKKSFCLTVKSPPALRHTVCNMLTAVFIMTGCNIWAAARYTQIILFKILNDRSSVSSLGAVASALSRLNHIKRSSSPRSFHLSLSRVFLLSPFFFSFFFFFFLNRPACTCTAFRFFSSHSLTPPPLQSFCLALPICRRHVA